MLTSLPWPKFRQVGHELGMLHPIHPQKPQKARSSNMRCFYKMLSITNSARISPNYLAWFHPNPWRTDRVMGNSLKTSETRKFSTAPSVLPIAVMLMNFNARNCWNITFADAGHFLIDADAAPSQSTPTLINSDSATLTMWLASFSIWNLTLNIQALGSGGPRDLV